MQRWDRRPVWRVLDPHFGGGDAFVRRAAAWHADPQRPALLHHVGIAPQAPDMAALLARLDAAGTEGPGSGPGALSGRALSDGFHRLELAGGRILLTLCIGPLQAMLREQQFLADHIDLRAAPPGPDAGPWDLWTLKALARLCRRGTTAQLLTGAHALRRGMSMVGFAADPDTAGNETTATYQPAWEPGTSRAPWRTAPQPPSHCVVIGAGLAGACSAAALARRGWQVTVLDRAPRPAAGASGLPAGLIAPQPSRDDAARSRLARAGVRLTLQWCRRLLRAGVDWDCSGVEQRDPDSGPPTLHWHADAGWIRPARLVAACLATPGVRFVGAAAVQDLQPEAGGWMVRDPHGHALAQAEHVVLAAAGHSVDLLLRATDTAPGRATLRPMATVQGQVSWGLRRAGDEDGFPPFPVNGHGHLLPAVPLDEGLAWIAGASYEPDCAAPLDENAAHHANQQRLDRLLPQTAQALAACFADGQARAWRGARATTRDRLPAIGAAAVGHGLWISAGMGSRGLTYAVLGAELLAARLGGEPLPVEGRLAQMLAAARPGLSDHL